MGENRALFIFSPRTGAAGESAGPGVPSNAFLCLEQGCSLWLWQNDQYRWRHQAPSLFLVGCVTLLAVWPQPTIHYSKLHYHGTHLMGCCEIICVKDTWRQAVYSKCPISFSCGYYRLHGTFAPPNNQKTSLFANSRSPYGSRCGPWAVFIEPVFLRTSPAPWFAQHPRTRRKTNKNHRTSNRGPGHRCLGNQVVLGAFWVKEKQLHACRSQRRIIKVNPPPEKQGNEE